MALSRGPKIITDGLILCLDAADKKSYSGSGDTWYDRSGNDYDGTLTNDPTFSDANGGCLVFDGVDDSVSFSATKTADCTFSCWAKTTEATVAEMSDMLFNAGSNNFGPDLYFASSRISWNIWNGTTNYFCATPSLVGNGNYHNYCVICDSSTDLASLYIDGVLYGTADHTSTYQTRLTDNTNFYIGGSPTNYNWKGSISEFKMYNKTLSFSEVLQNFNAMRGRFGV